MTAARSILHVDLDAFFASVEQRDDPSLRGKPVLVGGSRERGVVAAASYEARRFGCRSAMPMAEALRRCPRAIVVPHRFDRYREASRAFFAILGDFTPLVEPLSIDEAFLDATGTERLFGDAADVARRIKERVRAELSLVASVGVAPIKFAAKIASDLDKPDGLRVVAPEELAAFLRALPVSRLWGVGERTQATLESLGLRTIGQVAAYPAAALERRVGPALGAHLAALARGEDPREVTPEHEPVTVGHEETFERDVGDPALLDAVVRDQAEAVASRLRRGGLRARVVVLKVKYADFQLLTRRRTLADASCDGAVLGQVASELLARIPVDDDHGPRRRVRLTGVAAAGLERRDAPRQLTFDEADRDRGERLGDLLDDIRDRFGDAAIGKPRRR